MLSIVCRCKCAASGASSVGPTMRRRETVERRRRQNSFTFSGGDYHHGGGAGRKQRTYSRTRAPQLSPRYQLLNTLASSAPPSDSQPMSAVLHFQTLPAGNDETLDGRHQMLSTVLQFQTLPAGDDETLDGRHQMLSTVHGPRVPDPASWQR